MPRGVRYTEEEYQDMMAQGNVRIVGKPGSVSVKPEALVARGLPPAPPTAPPKLDRYKSETERRYAALLRLYQQAGTIVQFWYEPCKGLYLAPKLSYTPDFLVYYADKPRLEFHEVKGAFIRDKDWIRLKQAAALYPCFRFVRAQWKDNQWHWQDIPAL